MNQLNLNGALIKITVYTKNVYGNNLIYPIGNLAHSFIKLTGTKTLSKYHLNIIRSMGIEVEQVVGSEVIDGINQELQLA